MICVRGRAICGLGARYWKNSMNLQLQNAMNNLFDTSPKRPVQNPTWVHYNRQDRRNERMQYTSNLLTLISSNNRKKSWIQLAIIKMQSRLRHLKHGFIMQSSSQEDVIAVTTWFNFYHIPRRSITRLISSSSSSAISSSFGFERNIYTMGSELENSTKLYRVRRFSNTYFFKHNRSS